MLCPDKTSLVIVIMNHVIFIKIIIMMIINFIMIIIINIIMIIVPTFEESDGLFVLGNVFSLQTFRVFNTIF